MLFRSGGERTGLILLGYRKMPDYCERGNEPSGSLKFGEFMKCFTWQGDNSSPQRYIQGTIMVGLDVHDVTLCKIMLHKGASTDRIKLVPGGMQWKGLTNTTEHRFAVFFCPCK